MPRVVGIDHLAIKVRDFARSKDFYDRLLGFLGFTLEWEFDHVAGWDNGVTMFWIAQADARGRRYRPRIGDVGYHHYAFELAARRDVDALHAFLRKNKVKVVDPPADYPSYGEGYYAVYFLDPDGLKLEAMYFLGKAKRRRDAARRAKARRK